MPYCTILSQAPYKYFCVKISRMKGARVRECDLGSIETSARPDLTWSILQKNVVKQKHSLCIRIITSIRPDLCSYDRYIEGKQNTVQCTPSVTFARLMRPRGCNSARRASELTARNIKCEPYQAGASAECVFAAICHRDASWLFLKHWYYSSRPTGISSTPAQLTGIIQKILTRLSRSSRIHAERFGMYSFHETSTGGLLIKVL